MKKRILVVENNKDILELISLVLEEAGYHLSLYTNENGIFEHILEFQPHAILLDIVKPTIHGSELCKQLKASENTCNIPVVVLSTHPQIHKVKEVCADEVVEKPFDIDGLLEAIADSINSTN
jgi:DNA-binding response OmpR family regulator